MQTEKLNQESKKYGKLTKEFQSYLIENLNTNLSIEEILQNYLELKNQKCEKSSFDEGLSGLVFLEINSAR